MMPDNNSPQRFIYLHGFNSSPASGKAQEFAGYFNKYFAAHADRPDLQIPALPFDPSAAMGMLERMVSEAGNCFLVGSSLGAYYATWLLEKYGGRAALINPAVSPARNLDPGMIGRHGNYHTGEENELTAAHVDFLRTLETTSLKKPENYLLLVQTGDELLDYREAVKKYAGARQVIQEGGNHGFENFAAVLPLIFEFAMS